MNASRLSAAIVADAHSPTGDALAIVAERRLSVAALAALLLRDTRYRVVREARGLAGVTQAFRSFRPVVLIVDSVWAGWPPLLDPSAWGGRTLLLVDPADKPDVFVRAAQAGVHGYLSRTASPAAFAAAIETFRTTGYHLDGLLGGGILSALREASYLPAAEGATLSLHERGILVRVANGRSSKEIAREFAITPKTVANHVTNMYQKLGLKHRGELVLYAAQEGLTSLECPDRRTTIPFKMVTTLR